MIYLVFASEQYYPSMGWHDHKGTFDNYFDAMESLRDLCDEEFANDDNWKYPLWTGHIVQIFPDLRSELIAFAGRDNDIDMTNNPIEIFPRKYTSGQIGK
jgi:hypothetical protein